MHILNNSILPNTLPVRKKIHWFCCEITWWSVGFFLGLNPFSISNLVISQTEEERWNFKKKQKKTRNSKIKTAPLFPRPCRQRKRTNAYVKSKDQYRLHTEGIFICHENLRQAHISVSMCIYTGRYEFVL